MERLNLALPPEAITAAVDELTRDRSAMSLEAANREVYLLLKEGIKVSMAESDSTPHPGPSPGRGGESGASRHNRVETERFKCFTYDELLKRDKVNLDIFWLKDESLEESANLPAPEVIAREIADDLEAALEQFATIAEDLKR